MAELDRFEARLAASLERLADEVPTEVDAARMARTVAASGARRGWLGPLSGTRGRQLVPVLQVALVMAAILALLLGMIALAPRLTRAPLDSTIHGSMTCAGAPWTAASSEPVDLTCTSGLADPRLAGDVTIRLGAPSSVGGPAVRQGALEIAAPGATWSGAIQVMTADNGVAVGDAVLSGAGDAAGLTLHARLLSGDGVRWGLLLWPGVEE